MRLAQKADATLIKEAVEGSPSDLAKQIGKAERLHEAGIDLRRVGLREETDPIRIVHLNDEIARS